MEVFFYTMNSVDNWICSKEIEARSLVEFLDGVGFLAQANKMKANLKKFHSRCSLETEV